VLSFINEVEAQKGIKIPEDLADRWIIFAEEIAQSLNELRG